MIRKNGLTDFFRMTSPDWLKRIIIDYCPTNMIHIITGGSSKQKIKDIQLAVEKNELLIPNTLCIELTNHCNAKCIFCPQPNQMKRAKGIMTDELFEIILENIKKYNISRVMLGGIGEPFLDKKIIDRISKLKHLSVHVAVTTNGSLLDNFSPEKIVRSGLDEISISIDAIDDIYLRQIKPGIKKSLNEIERAIGEICKYKKKVNSKTPLLLSRYQILEKSNNMTDKKKEEEIIREREKVICDKVELRKQHDWIGEMENLKPTENSPSTEKRICNYLCRTMGVNWDGTVSFCCMDYDNKIVLGNLFESNIVEVFNSVKINKARKMLLKGTISKHPLCSGCYKE
jgi:MoaA/NifB/PqqE/SkfB family radical SAM enzyme